MFIKGNWESYKMLKFLLHSKPKENISSPFPKHLYPSKNKFCYQNLKSLIQIKRYSLLTCYILDRFPLRSRQMWLCDFEPDDQFEPNLTDATSLQDTKLLQVLWKSWKQKESQFPTSGETGIVCPLTNLDGNLRISNQTTNSFLPGIAHTVPLSTTEIGSLWGAGEFSYPRHSIMGCRREFWHCGYRVFGERNYLEVGHWAQHLSLIPTVQMIHLLFSFL